MKYPTYKKETEYLNKGFDFVAGCDEVGVGPLAGPVVAAVCILDPRNVAGRRTKSRWFYRIRDSKTVQETEREQLAKEIKKHCIAYGIGEVSAKTIDQINIHNASLLAMQRGLEDLLKKFPLKSNKLFLFVDGRFNLKKISSKNILQEAIIDGDAKILSISAASIIAKVYRDNILKKMDAKLPIYEFGKHKGYGTKKHYEVLYKHGPSKYHRKSFLKNLNMQQQKAK